MGSAHQQQQQQQQQVHQQLYGDRAYWQFVLHANNDIVLIIVFGVLAIHLLASFALILRTFTRDKVSPSVCYVHSPQNSTNQCFVGVKNFSNVCLIVGSGYSKS